MTPLLILSLTISKRVALRPQKRDGLLGTGKRGEGEKELRPAKTEEAVDHRQNN